MSKVRWITNIIFRKLYWCATPMTDKSDMRDGTYAKIYRYKNKHKSNYFSLYWLINFKTNTAIVNKTFFYNYLWVFHLIPLKLSKFTYEMSAIELMVPIPSLHVPKLTLLVRPAPRSDKDDRFWRHNRVPTSGIFHQCCACAWSFTFVRR